MCMHTDGIRGMLKLHSQALLCSAMTAALIHSPSLCVLCMIAYYFFHELTEQTVLWE